MTDWARIMTPLSGGEGDRRVLAAGAAVAEVFGAELACVHAPADVADLIPWMGDGFMGGVQATAVQSLREAAAAGEKAARTSADACPYHNKTFTALASPVWAALAMEGRLSDVVLFDFATARGKGALSEAFQQILADEQRPTLVAHEGLAVGGPIAVAWDGGKEASRAVRTSIPLLRKASGVVILSAPAASPLRRGVSPAVPRRAGSGGDHRGSERPRRPRPRSGQGGEGRVRRHSGGGRLRPPAPAGICVRRRHQDVPARRGAVALPVSLTPARA